MGNPLLSKNTDEFSPLNIPKTIVLKIKKTDNDSFSDSFETDPRNAESQLDLKDVMEKFPDLTMERVFSSTSQQNLDQLSDSLDNEKKREIDLLSFYRIEVPVGENIENILEKLRKNNIIEEAYVEGGPTPPPVIKGNNNPRYSSQEYLKPAPVGINVPYAWNFKGGSGTGIQFVDLEQGWTLNHEDLLNRNITLISGINQAFFGHGTSVLGQVVAIDNDIGNIGIAHGVLSARVVSQFRTSTKYNTADAILSAINVLNYGDILLLEAQTLVRGITNYLPVEVERAVFDIIQLATLRGIIVIEAGGNGNNDLDLFKDNNHHEILNRNSHEFKDSGAIMVGAASSTVPHSRMYFSNYGSRIDCYAWGENIDTTGDGWEGNLTNSYTTDFGGTSGASPIITGAALCLQGIAKSKGHLLSPYEMRSILSDTSIGTLSSDPTVDRIGVMPDLHNIIDKYMNIILSEKISN